MSNYPDKWIVFKITNKYSISIYKVFASWYGGYLGSDRWKLSSGITEIVDRDTHYEIHNHSGSIYMCGKHSQGMSGYTASVFNSFVKDLEGKGTIEAVEYEG